ncbi:hypothetical protein V1514DRAFT_335224 [Lipomyces japonicus]|uniref:uncharacterized protein n=1 Tax=Lipomyces japonicus TaxID=56871 RepID=UPI0034CD2547
MSDTFKYPCVSLHQVPQGGKRILSFSQARREFEIGRSSSRLSSTANNRQETSRNAYFDAPNISRHHAVLRFGKDKNRFNDDSDGDSDGDESDSDEDSDYYDDDVTNGVVTIMDCSSLHGTFLNGVKLLPSISYVLADGDKIELAEKIKFNKEIIKPTVLVASISYPENQHDKQEDQDEQEEKTSTSQTPMPDAEHDHEKEDDDDVEVTILREKIININDDNDDDVHEDVEDEDIDATQGRVEITHDDHDVHDTADVTGGQQDHVEIDAHDADGDDGDDDDNEEKVDKADYLIKEQAFPGTKQKLDDEEEEKREKQEEQKEQYEEEKEKDAGQPKFSFDEDEVENAMGAAEFFIQEQVLLRGTKRKFKFEDDDDKDEKEEKEKEEKDAARPKFSFGQLKRRRVTPIASPPPSPLLLSSSPSSSSSSSSVAKYIAATAAGVIIGSVGTFAALLSSAADNIGN